MQGIGSLLFTVLTSSNQNMPSDNWRRLSNSVASKNLSFGYHILGSICPDVQTRVCVAEVFVKEKTVKQPIHH